MKFDVSKCIFIFSYNDSSLIDPILMNRIEEITLHPIVFQEKVHILQNYTLPKLLESYKIPKSFAKYYSKEVLSHIVLRYTNEPGVRNSE
jgi:ATP-dependent Lon protease